MFLGRTIFNAIDATVMRRIRPLIFGAIKFVGPTNRAVLLCNALAVIIIIIFFFRPRAPGFNGRLGRGTRAPLTRGRRKPIAVDGLFYHFFNGP